MGEVYQMQSPGLNIQGRITALSECGLLADEEINDGDLIGAALMPQPDDPATPCASLLITTLAQPIAYIVPLDYLQNRNFWKPISTRE